MATYNLTDLTDPQKFQKKYPKTVRAISPRNWCNAKVGMYVKIRRNNEYFWVQIREINNTQITGEVYYKLHINKFVIGDLLVFNRCHMFDVYDPQILNLIPGLNEFEYKRAATRSWTFVPGPSRNSVC